MIREGRDFCLFKIADGSLMYSEEAAIEDDGVTFDMDRAWVLVTKTNDKGLSELKMFGASELMFKPSVMYFPWTSIVMCSDMIDESRDQIRQAFTDAGMFAKDNASEEEKFLPNEIEGKF